MQPKSDIVTSEIFNEKQFNFCLQTKDRVDSLCEKYQNTEVFLVRIFFLFGLNTGIYHVNLHIQSEYTKIQTRKTSVFGHFSRSENCTELG